MTDIKIEDLFDKFAFLVFQHSTQRAESARKNLEKFEEKSNRASNARQLASIAMSACTIFGAALSITGLVPMLQGWGNFAKGLDTGGKAVTQLTNVAQLVGDSKAKTSEAGAQTAQNTLSQDQQTENQLLDLLHRTQDQWRRLQQDFYENCIRAMSRN